MVTATRITPYGTFQKVRSGKALLVCAYDSDEQFKSLQLDGAISFSEFRTKLP